MATKALEWYCKPVEKGVWAEVVKDAFGAYTPCGIDSIVVGISHLVLMFLCLYRIWRIKKDHTVKKFVLRSKYYNYFLGLLAIYCTAEPLYRLVMGISVLNLDGQTGLAPFEIVSLLIEAVVWCSMLIMIGVETKVYIREFRWYVRFGVIYVLIGEAVMINLVLSLQQFYQNTNIAEATTLATRASVTAQEVPLLVLCSRGFTESKVGELGYTTCRMVSEYGIKLATSLITSHFGDIVSRVCDCLLRKGTLTLSEITRDSELPSQQVKNCLLVLIQHNCVQAFDTEKEGDSGVSPKIITHYTAISENILHRIRFSKFLAIVSEELGRECEELLDGLLQHGRLTLEQIILRSASNQNEGNAIIQDTIRAHFAKLVDAHYVERCPAAVPFIAPRTETLSTGTNGVKSGKLIEVESLEKRAMIAAIPSEAERFSVTTDSRTDVTVEAESQGTSHNVVVGEKRKHADLETDEGINANICTKEVLWRANFKEFVRCLRHKACVANVRSRLDSGVAIVLNAMLKATRISEEKVKCESTGDVPLLVNDIFKEVVKNEEGLNMTLEHVKAALCQLGCHPITGEREESYCVDIKNIIEIAQTNEVESVLLEKYGQLTHRIFKLLSKTDCLIESHKIAAQILGEKKEVFKVLCNLWKDGYLQMQKITHGSQSHQFLLWKVNKCSVKEHMLDDMFHAVLNLSQRIANELEKEHEIVKLPRDKRVGAQGKRYERIRKVKILLESSLMKLDDVLMLFHDF